MRQMSPEEVKAKFGFDPDPGDALSKATRDEVEAFAKSRGLILDQNMPVELMRRECRSRGFTDIPVYVRVMGRVVDVIRPGAAQAIPPEVKEVDALEDLARQYKAKAEIADIDKMTMGQLKKEAKRRGLVIPRTAKKPEVLSALKAA